MLVSQVAKLHKIKGIAICKRSLPDFSTVLYPAWQGTLVVGCGELLRVQLQKAAVSPRFPN